MIALSKKDKEEFIRIVSESGVSVAADRFNINIIKARSLANELGVVKTKTGTWRSSEEDEILISNYGKIPLKEIAQILNCSVGSARGGLIKLGIENKRKKWGEREDIILRENYGKKSINEIAFMTGFSVQSIYNMIKKRINT